MANMPALFDHLALRHNRLIPEYEHNTKAEDCTEADLTPFTDLEFVQNSARIYCKIEIRECGKGYHQSTRLR